MPEGWLGICSVMPDMNGDTWSQWSWIVLTQWASLCPEFLLHPHPLPFTCPHFMYLISHVPLFPALPSWAALLPMSWFGMQCCGSSLMVKMWKGRLLTTSSSMQQCHTTSRTIRWPQPGSLVESEGIFLLSTSSWPQETPSVLRTLLAADCNSHLNPPLYSVSSSSHLGMSLAIMFANSAYMSSPMMGWFPSISSLFWLPYPLISFQVISISVRSRR